MWWRRPTFRGEHCWPWNRATICTIRSATLCDAFGATLLRDYEGTSLDTLRQMAGMGVGLAVLPALYVHSEIAGRGEVPSSS